MSQAITLQTLTPLPPQYAGLWRRTAIRRRDGSRDALTRAWWFQSARFQIDLRIPPDRPALADAAALALLTPRQLARFAAQSGFAGSTVVEAGRCEWRPEIAFPAVSEELDAGFMRFDTPDNLHETGVDGAYEEDWVRVATGPVLGLRLEAQPSGAFAYLLVADAWAAWACGRPEDAFAPRSEAGPWSEFAILHRDVAGAWHIVASNRPWLEGGSAFDNAPLALAQLSRRVPGDILTLPTPHGRHWRISDLSAPDR